MRRLFFALWPDHYARSCLTGILRQLDGNELNPVRSDNLHVTLKFLGSVPEARVAQIQREAAAIWVDAFDIVFDRLEFWPRPKVLSLTCATIPDKLLVLESGIRRLPSLSHLAKEHSPFVPHVTLARKARNPVNLDVEPFSWRADSFCLVESNNRADRPVYSILASWLLAG